MARSTDPPPGIDFNHQQHVKVLERWFPREFLRRPDLQIDQLIVEKVQNVKLDLFLSLKVGDILFIDSSHVIRTGSDVQYLYLEILPRIPTEVLVHIHDIFLPAEYPKEWALEENRSWNEQYLLQALLAHSNKFSVFFGCCYAHYFLSESLSKALGRAGKPSYGGRSFWIKSCR